MKISGYVSVNLKRKFCRLKSSLWSFILNVKIAKYTAELFINLDISWFCQTMSRYKYDDFINTVQQLENDRNETQLNHSVDWQQNYIIHLVCGGSWLYSTFHCVWFITEYWLGTSHSHQCCNQLWERCEGSKISEKNKHTSDKCSVNGRKQGSQSMRLYLS